MALQDGTLFSSIEVITDGGQAIEDFSEVSVQRSLDSLSAKFSLQMPNIWHGQSAIISNALYGLDPGARAILRIDGEHTLMTGHVESIVANTRSDSNQISISGRDVTGDLIDCSPYPATEYNKQTLKEIAGKVCAPFKLRVTDDFGDKMVFEKAKVNSGETAFAFLSRLARQRGALLCNDRMGGLVICKVGVNRYDHDRLDPTNIIQFRTTVNAQKVFSEYNVVARLGSGDRSALAKALGVEGQAGVRGLVKDSSARRYRPLTMVTEKSTTQEGAQTRAEWESSRRLARSLKIQTSVNGWKNSQGQVWEENTIIPIFYLYAGVEGDYLISSVEFKYGANQAQVTEMTLVSPSAYSPKPENITKEVTSGLRFDFTGEELDREVAALGLPPLAPAIKNTGGEKK